MTTTAGTEAAKSPVSGADAARAAVRAAVGDAADKTGAQSVRVTERVSAVDRVRAGLVAGSGWQGIDVRSLPRLELIAAHRDLSRMRRELDAMLAVSSSEIGRRSAPDEGASGLAKREGFGTPEQFIASISGGSTGDAHKLIEVGDAMARHAGTQHGEVDDKGSQDNSGEAEGVADGHESASTPQPINAEPKGADVVPRFAVVGGAVRSGKLSIDAASATTRMLTRIWDRRDALGVEMADVERVERLLVERAHGLSVNRFVKIVRQIEAQMDAGRHALTEELQRQERSVTMFEDKTGMFILHARLDAETAAPVRAAIDALVGDAMRQKRDQNQVAEDDRSVVQMRADSLAALAKHCLGCDSQDLPLASTMVVVRMTLDDVREGKGVAEIDGGRQPVCISTARRMAANGHFIPVVLGGKSEILDLGRGSRLYNRAQRIALIERDGGCAFCGAPPSYTEVHHIRWWSRDCGPTDLDNGILLCSTCHHRIHRDDWEIQIRDHQPWFIPPAAVDPTREPRLGGRARFYAPHLSGA